MPELTRCAVCGATLQPSDRFCPQCGTVASAGIAGSGAGIMPAPAAPAASEWPGAAGQAAAAAAAYAAPAAVQAVPEDRGWFVSTRASSMLGSALMLLIGSLLLMGIGQIDRTGTIVIISLLVLEGAAAMLLMGILRGVIGAFSKG